MTTDPYERGAQTPRRMKAVETLIALGWKWDGSEWTAPALLNGVEGLVTEWRARARKQQALANDKAGDETPYVYGMLADQSNTHANELEAALRAADNRDVAGVGNSAEDRMHRHRDPYTTTPTAAPAEVPLYTRERS